MTADSTLLRIVDEGDLLEVRFATDTIVDEVSIQGIAGELQELARGRETPRCIINFSGVRHFSSAGLGMLVDLNTTVQERNGCMVLSDISDTICEVFKITKLDRVFDIEATSAEARSNLG